MKVSKKVIMFLVVLILFGNYSMSSNKKVEPIIPVFSPSLSDINKREMEEFDKIMQIIEQEELAKIERNKVKLFSTIDPALITSINKIRPKLLDLNKTDQYDKYDEEIIEAVQELKLKGETPNANFIKSIMIIETGMIPTKNYKGYEGFPQTKINVIKSVNKKNGTNFTMKDMYDAKRSAQFIHYYVKGLKQSGLVKNDQDLIIAYNWGIGNLGKYKKGIKKLPKQSKDYVSMIKVMKKYYI